MTSCLDSIVHSSQTALLFLLRCLGCEDGCFVFPMTITFRIASSSLMSGASDDAVACGPFPPIFQDVTDCFVAGTSEEHSPIVFVILFVARTAPYHITDAQFLIFVEQVTNGDHEFVFTFEASATDIVVHLGPCLYCADNRSTDSAGCSVRKAELTLCNSSLIDHGGCALVSFQSTSASNASLGVWPDSTRIRAALNVALWPPPPLVA